jgi:hypothetical protein
MLIIKLLGGKMSISVNNTKEYAQVMAAHREWVSRQWEKVAKRPPEIIAIYRPDGSRVK